MDPEHKRYLDQAAQWANDTEPDRSDWEAAVAARRAEHAEEHDCTAAGCYEETTWKHRLWKAIDDPLDWWFYPAAVRCNVLGNVWYFGLTAPAVRGGLVGGLIGVVVFCRVRRWLVGHWRYYGKSAG